MDYSQLGNKRQKRMSNPQTTRVRNKIGLLILRVALALALVAGFGLFGIGLGLYRGILLAMPEMTFDGIVTENRTSTIVCARTGAERERLHAGHNFEFAPLYDENGNIRVPMHVRHAFIAIEDERFFEHNGIDIRGIGRALELVIRTGGQSTQGASTITQQLIKNWIGDFDTDLIGKIQEQYLAVSFERQLVEEFDGDVQAAKNYILELYLNIINLGRQNYGVQAAAWFYYGVDVSELTIAQAATIAAITQNPSRFPPDVRASDNWMRTQLVLRNMLRLGFITQEEFDEAMAYEVIGVDEETGEDITLGLVYQTIFRMDGGGTRPLMSAFDCFTDALLDQVRDDLIAQRGLNAEQANNLIFSGGVEIHSTQNFEMQAIVDAAFLDDSLWPTVDFTVDVEYHMTVRNTVTQQPRHYTRTRTGIPSMEEAEAFIESLHEELLGPGDEIEFERRFFMPQPQGAFVLLDHHTGHVLAMRGIRGEKEGNRVFNRATQAIRSPGSQMKPLAAFAPAFDLGIMQPATVIDDIPFTFVGGGAPWTPGNWWGSGFEGLSTVRRAIYHSMNVVSARAIVDSNPHVGVETMLSYLRNMGLTTLQPTDGPAVVLGGMDGVRLIELAGAYGMIANGGELHRPVLYTKVYAYDGSLLLDNRHEEPRRVLRADSAYLLINTMRDTVTRGTGGMANWTDSALRQAIPISGKTGTSENVRDLGFTASTPYFTGAMWMGNDSNQPMHWRNNHHMPIWRAIMEPIHAGLPPRGFERPPGIVTAAVCRDSGHPATEFCQTDPRGNRVRTEVFASGRVPTTPCPVHRQFTICTEHGYLAGAFCPPEHVVTRSGIVRLVPIDHLTEHVADRHIEFPLAVRQGIVCPHHTEQNQFNWYDSWNWGEWGEFDRDPASFWNPWEQWGDLPPPPPPEPEYEPAPPVIVETDDTWITG